MHLNDARKYFNIIPMPMGNSILPQYITAGIDPSLLKMLELAVAEIQHQDEQVWTMKQDENNWPVQQAIPHLVSYRPHFTMGLGF